MRADRVVESDTPSAQSTERLIDGFGNMIPKPIPFGASVNSASAPGAMVPRLPDPVFGLMINPPVMVISPSVLNLIRFDSICSPSSSFKCSETGIHESLRQTTSRWCA